MAAAAVVLQPAAVAPAVLVPRLCQLFKFLSTVFGALELQARLFFVVNPLQLASTSQEGLLSNDGLQYFVYNNSERIRDSHKAAVETLKLVKEKTWSLTAKNQAQ